MFFKIVSKICPNYFRHSVIYPIFWITFDSIYAFTSFNRFNNQWTHPSILYFDGKFVLII